MENKENKAIEQPSLEEDLSLNTEVFEDTTPSAAANIVDNSEDANIEQEEKDLYNIDEYDDEDDDEFVLEDEFSNIPDSYFDDDIQLSEEDEATSIAALLYDDDDATASNSDFEMHTNVSFSELKQQMQKIKDEAKDLRAEETEITADEIVDEIADETADEINDAESEVSEDQKDEISEAEDRAPESDEDNCPPIEEDSSDDVVEDVQEETPIEEVKKSYIRDRIRTEEIHEEIAESPVKEHVITIDRSRVKEKSTPTDRFIDRAFEVVEILVFALLAIIAITTFVFRQTTVSGSSMVPTFNDGDKLIISDLFYTPEVGDVIVFDDRSKDYGEYGQSPIIKRVFAVSGETVDIKAGKITVYTGNIEDNVIARYIYINGIKDMEKPLYIEEGQIYVLGDNTYNSMDSRDVGTISVESILGKVILRYKSDGKFVFDTKFN